MTLIALNTLSGTEAVYKLLGNYLAGPKLQRIIERNEWGFGVFDRLICSFSGFYSFFSSICCSVPCRLGSYDLGFRVLNDTES